MDASGPKRRAMHCNILTFHDTSPPTPAVSYLTFPVAPGAAGARARNRGAHAPVPAGVAWSAYPNPREGPPMRDVAPFTTHRRGFLTRLAGAAGLAAIAPARLFAQPAASADDPALEAWFNRIRGTHRIVFDAPAANGGMPAIWPRVYMDTMNATYGTTAADDTAVVIFRHEGAPVALDDAMWAKYGFGAQLNVDEHGKPATRNVYADITNLPLTGIGVKPLLEAGVLIGVCNVALTMLGMAIAGKTGGNADAIHKELVAHVIPGVQLVPSGVMAVGRAQEKGCNYCFAG